MYENLDDYQFNGKIDQSQNSLSLKVEKREEPPNERQKPKLKKKAKVQNQGIKIIEQRKIKNVFQKICNPNGLITFQSLGKSFVKYTGSCDLEAIKKMLYMGNQPQQSQKVPQIDLETFTKLYNNLYNKD